MGNRFAKEESASDADESTIFAKDFPSSELLKWPDFQWPKLPMPSLSNPEDIFGKVQLPMPSLSNREDIYGKVKYCDQHVTVFEKGIEVKYYYHPLSRSRYFLFSQMLNAEGGIHRDHGWGRETAEDTYWAADLFSSGGPHHIVVTFKKQKLGKIGFSICKVDGDIEKCLEAILNGIASSDALDMTIADSKLPSNDENSQGAGDSKASNCLETRTERTNPSEGGELLVDVEESKMSDIRNDNNTESTNDPEDAGSLDSINESERLDVVGAEIESEHFPEDSKPSDEDLEATGTQENKDNTAEIANSSDDDDALAGVNNPEKVVSEEERSTVGEIEGKTAEK